MATRQNGRTGSAAESRTRPAKRGKSAGIDPGAFYDSVVFCDVLNIARGRQYKLVRRLRKMAPNRDDVIPNGHSIIFRAAVGLEALKQLEAPNRGTISRENVIGIL